MSIVYSPFTDETNLHSDHFKMGTFEYLQSKFTSDCKLIVSVLHNRYENFDGVMFDTQDTFSTNDFLVDIWSGVSREHITNTSGRSRYETPIKAWGISVPCIDTPMSPIAETLTLIDFEYEEIISPEGVYMGALYNRDTGKAPFNTLAVYWDLTHYGDEKESEILKNIFDEILTFPLVISDPISPEELLVSRIERVFEKKCKELKNKLVSVDARIEEYRITLTDLVHEREQFSYRLVNTSKLMKEQTKNIMNQLVDLKSQYNVQKVELTRGNILEVYTGPIYVQTERYGKHYIGKFRIEIGLETSHLLLFNLDNSKKGTYWDGASPHPHVDSSGIACWGNVGATVAQLQGEFQLVPLVNVIISFLESVNLKDSAGAYVWRWGETADTEYTRKSDILCTYCNEPIDTDEYYLEDEDVYFCCEDCYQDYLEGDE